MYNKKTLSKASAELDKAKAPKKPKDMITDPMGQWKYPGLPTRIPSNDITMKGVGYPVLGVANNGQRKIMLPGADYTFPGADYVDEYPQMRKGGVKKKKTKSLSGTNKLMLTHPLLRNYKNKVYDPNVDYFQKGGMKTVKSKDGTVTNRFINEAGDEVVQVKTKDGKYTEKVIPAIQQQKALRDIEKIVKVPFHPETEEEYDKLPADEKLRRFERTVDVNLGYPQKRAAQVAQDVTEPGNDPVDNIRHPFAGRYTAEAAYNSRKKNAPWAPDWLNKAGAWVDANALGVGHEATTLFKDKRPWGTKLRESAEDIYNNAVGVNVGLSDRSEREKDMTLINKSRYNKIPDGFGEERPFQLTNPKWTDPYDKKQDGGYIEAELTDDEIEEYRKGGYIVEDISVPELNQAQKGIISTKEYTDKKGNKTIKVRKEDGTLYTKVIDKDGKVFNKTFDPKKDSWATDQTKNLYSKAQGAGNSDWFWAPAALTAITGAPLLKSGATAIGEGIVAGGDAIANATLNQLGKSSLAQVAKEGTKAFFNKSMISALPGSSLNNLLTASGITYGVGDYLDKDSDLRQSYSKVAKDPTLQNVGEAASETGLNMLDFIGLGFGNKLKKVNDLKKVTLKIKKPMPKTLLDDLKDKVAELKKIDKPDLDEGEKIFNSLKQESLDFWKTPEGRRRVQKYLDENGLSKNGITPEMYADMMSDIGYQNKTETLAMRDDLNKIKEARETLRNQRFEFSKQVWALKDDKANLIKSSNPTPEDINAIKDIDKQLNELENKISLNSDRDSKYVELEALINVPEENAFYDIGKDKIFLGENWSRPVNIEQSGYHEWGHAKNLKPHFELEKWFPDTYRKEKLTNQFDDYGNVSPLNKRLRESLEFENEKSGDIPEHLMQELNIEELYKNAQPISEFGLKRYTDPKSYYQTSRNYFNENDESNAYLQELLPELKKRGYINKQGDLISPQMVENLFKEYRSDAAKNIVEPIRLLDIVRPTERSVNRITDELNNLHNWMIGAGGAGAAGATLSDDDESKPELKKGGIVAELSDDEIQDYINQGYIVEEVDEPEMQSGGQMPYQIWEEKTGTPWSEAKRQGLTDGSYEQNVALAQKLLADVTSVVKENLESKPTFDYNKYDQIVSTLVQKGNTLEDLVAQQIGTKEGLMKRYPKLFSASNTKSKAVNTANIPVRSVDEILKRTPAPINLKTPQTEMKSETLQYQNVPVKKLNLISDSNLKPKPVSSTVKQFERSKKVNETKLKEAEFKNYVNTIRESLTPDSVKKQKQLQNSFFPTAPKKKLTVKEPLTQESPQEFKARMLKIQQGLNLKPIQTNPEKIAPIKNFQDLQGEPGKFDIVSPNLPEVNGKQFPVKKPVVKAKPPQDITKFQNTLKPEIKKVLNKLINEVKPETEEKVVKEDSGYKVISNLTNRMGSYDQSLQNLYYDYTNPKHSPEKRKQVKAAFDNKLKERNNLVTTINSKKRDYAGGLDSWIDESAPAWIKKPAQKYDLSDQVEATSYKLPKLETYKEKEEKENEKFRTTKRFDDLGGNEKGSRWQFRVAASNDDPMKVQVYGTRAERNPDLNIKSKGAVMHFLDQSPLTGYMHPLTKDYYNNLKPDGFVGKLEKQKDGNFAVKYVPKKDIPAKDLHKNTFLVRQEKFDNIDFNKKVADNNFPGHTYWTKKGSTKATIPVSSGKDPNVYDYSSGQSVVFIFPYKGKTRYVHYAGSPNAIKKEGEEIKKLYKLQANKLVLGVADAGSYSSSVKGNITDKKLKDWSYGYANRNSFTGAGMALVD